MKKFVNFVFGLVIASFITAPVYSDECRDVLNQCNDALNAELDLNKSLKQVNTDQENLISALNTQVAQEAIWKPVAIGAGAAALLEAVIIILRK